MFKLPNITPTKLKLFRTLGKRSIEAFHANDLEIVTPRIYGNVFGKDVLVVISMDDKSVINTLQQKTIPLDGILGIRVLDRKSFEKRNISDFKKKLDGSDSQLLIISD